jgi:hypothetical protein
MNKQSLAMAFGIAAALSIGLGAQQSAADQHPAPAMPKKPYLVPRTPWGDPDLQGIWPSTSMVGVPFERPNQYGNRLFLTDAELREREQQAE